MCSGTWLLAINDIFIWKIWAQKSHIRYRCNFVLPCSSKSWHCLSTLALSKETLLLPALQHNDLYSLPWVINVNENTLLFRAWDFPGRLRNIITNQTPTDLYVFHEAAVSLQIVVQTRSLQVQSSCHHWSQHHHNPFTHLWTRRGEGFISTDARSAGVREQTVACQCWIVQGIL